MSKLILIGVPIGNLGDITERASRALSEQKYFYVEDTRTFKALLGHLGISFASKLIDSFHDHSDSKKITSALKRLEEGEDICLVSEAGSPVISDPAFPLIQKTLEAGHEIESIPGVSSPIVALELSGLPPHPFHFHGFLPRGDHFESLKQNGTHIFFEAPTRVRKTLLDLAKELPEAKIVVARELTKKFQSLYRFDASLCHEYLDQITYKGEFVILVFLSNKIKRHQNLQELARDYLGPKQTPKQLAKILAALTGQTSKEIYQLLNS